jgi:hypothetical protein
VASDLSRGAGSGDAAGVDEDYNQLIDDEADRKEANLLFSIDNKYEMVIIFLINEYIIFLFLVY